MCAMSVKEIGFWYWVVKWLVPNKVKYFCFMHIMAYSTTGKYGTTIVPEITGLDAIKRYGNDKKIV
jgi:hypothetical protein